MNLSIRTITTHCKNTHFIIGIFLAAVFTLSCTAQTFPQARPYDSVRPGAAQFAQYLPLLQKKKVAVVTNATGIIGSASIVDTLLSLGVRIKKIFGPEHGFRGNTDAGEKVATQRDKRTGLPVISLYGASKKPSQAQLKGIDVVVYDIQDVGVRFYTYISTMCYVMEACAEAGVDVIVCDRPNPNGFYVDGPVLDPSLKSFLGLHPVPVVYGMTCGEYARMANEEGWLAGGRKCRLTIATMEGYDRNSSYDLPVKPSPNLPTYLSVLLYPGMGLFEGTIMSLGRGTPFPFQVVGHPAFPSTAFCFTPQPGEITKVPKLAGKKCCGTDLRTSGYTTNHPRRIDLRLLIDTYNAMNDTAFFDRNFDAHAGVRTLKEQIRSGTDESTIRRSWQPELDRFLAIRKKYLLYPDF